MGVAIVMIVLSLAPSVAQAHVLHRHHAVVDVHGGHHQAASDQTTQAASPAVLQAAQPGQTDDRDTSDRNCVGACCASVCASCCAAGLPDLVQLAPLSGSSTRVGFARSETGTDRAPEKLRRPPRTFS